MAEKTDGEIAAPRTFQPARFAVHQARPSTETGPRDRALLQETSGVGVRSQRAFLALDAGGELITSCDRGS